MRPFGCNFRNPIGSREPAIVDGFEIGWSLVQ